MPHIENIQGPVRDCEFRRATLEGRASVNDLPFFKLGVSVWRELDTSKVFVMVEIEAQVGQTRGVELCATADLPAHALRAPL